MLNLLRFKDDQGREAYSRYGQKVVPLVQELGGEVVFSGDCAEAVIGPTEGEWDAVLLVRYPSRQAFLDMIASPQYGEAHPDRVAAIADSRLIACSGNRG